MISWKGEKSGAAGITFSSAAQIVLQLARFGQLVHGEIGLAGIVTGHSFTCLEYPYFTCFHGKTIPTDTVPISSHGRFFSSQIPWIFRLKRAKGLPAMNDLKKKLSRFLEGDAPHDLRQKIFQVVLEYKEAMIDLLTLAIPQIAALDPIIQDIRAEDLTVSVIQINENDQAKVLGEKRLDYLVRLHLGQVGCEVLLFILHQSSTNHLIELEMAQYILQQYLKDARQRTPLLGTIPLILNTTVDTDWQPKPQFIDILACPDNEIVRQGSINFRIWSLNVNDPKLKELSREKPIMALLILEQLKKKNLSLEAAMNIMDDAMVVINAINLDGVYEQVVKLETILIAANYPEKREIIDAALDRLARDPHYDKKEIQEINMTYGEQQYFKAKTEGREEGAQELLLTAVKKRFGSNAALESTIRSFHELDVLHRLIAALLDPIDQKTFQEKLDEFTRH